MGHLMSEGNSLQSADMASAADEPVTQASAGALLRAARETAGLHVAALAVSMKVPVKKLEALEADRFDLLPDAVFVRALASSVCRNLKIDPAPILSRLPHQHVPRLGGSEGGINAPFHAAGENRSLSVPAALKQPVVLVVLLLLVAALVVVFFPEWQTEAPPEEVAAPSESVLIVPSAQNAVPDVPAPSVIAAEPAAQAALAVASASPAPVPVAIAAAVAVPEVMKPASAPSLAPVAGQQVVFRVKGPSWVEVTDAKGVVLMRRNLVQGDAAGISGALPLSVVVGRADVTEVEVKGKPFSLTAFAKDNVARFEVK
nr:RodZ domain-containing protein [uncultured Rhodoferax sp.]